MAPDTAAAAVPGRAAVVPLPWPIDLALTVASHGWVHLAPWSWDAASGRLGRRERIAGQSGEIAIAQHGPRAVAIEWDGLPGVAASAIVARARRWISADWEPAAAVAVLRPGLPREAALIERGGGRLLRGSSFYEDFVKTLLTVNTGWSGTCRMAAALVAEPGGSAFPEPGTILDYGEARLRERARLGFRAPTLVAATRRMLDDGAIDQEGMAPREPLDHDYLISLKGIGPYAAAHCLLLLQDFARLPVDTTVTAYLRERHGCDAAGFAARHQDCAPYLALGYRLMRLCDTLDRAAAAQ